MKKTIFTLFSLFLICLGLNAQSGIVTTTPSIIQASTPNIILTYHAELGNKGLMGQSADASLYAHIGLITDKSVNSSDWKYAPKWGDNSVKYKLTWVDENTWQLCIRDLREYFGISATSDEVIKKIALVFRNADCTAEGKDAFGGDIFVDVAQDGFVMTMSSSLSDLVFTAEDNPVTFKLTANQSADFKFYVNDQLLSQKNGVREMIVSYKFPEKGKSYKVNGEAQWNGEVREDSMNLFFADATMEKDYPYGILSPGTHRIDNNKVAFCFPAPGKSQVLLVGSWDGFKASENSVMNYCYQDGQKYFWTIVDGLGKDKDHLYYYIVDQTYRVSDPYAKLVLDPYSDKWIPEEVLGDSPRYPYDEVAGNVVLAVLRAERDYQWKVRDFRPVSPADLVVYELLLRDFTGTEGSAQGNGTLKKAMEKLDYLKNLGVNAVELMPIMEFNGNNSWGYNTNFYFAPDKAYGTPEEYKAFIDACHERGMAVILDIVFNQADGLHPWYAMYPKESNPFFNVSAPHAYSVLNDWNQGHPLVVEQWKDALRYWLEEYRVDGFRFDLVKGLAPNEAYAGMSTDGYIPARVERMKELHEVIRSVNPHAYHINELLGTIQEENALSEDGQLNWSKASDDAGKFVAGNVAGLLGFDAVGWNRVPYSTISYAESHDEERMAYLQRTTGVVGVKGNHGAMMRRLGSLGAAMILRPGGHMLWQFAELGNEQTTKKSGGENNTDPKVVRWNYFDDPHRRGVYDSYSQLINLRLDNAILFGQDAKINANFSAADWQTGFYSTMQFEDQEIILLINPTMTAIQMTVSGVTGKSVADYGVASHSYGITLPAFEVAGSVLKVSRMPAHSYVVLTKGCYNGISSEETVSGGPVVYTRKGQIVVDGTYSNVAVYSMSGVRMNGLNLPSGFYVVRVDDWTEKVFVP